MNPKSINEVNDKVAIVTGAASGIGRATVELLHARGALDQGVFANFECKLADGKLIFIWIFHLAGRESACGQFRQIPGAFALPR
jgi:hypothetical protein